MTVLSCAAFFLRTVQGGGSGLILSDVCASKATVSLPLRTLHRRSDSNLFLEV